jgi:hypothetical protein
VSARVFDTWNDKTQSCIVKSTNVSEPKVVQRFCDRIPNCFLGRGLPRAIARENEFGGGAFAPPLSRTTPMVLKFSSAL